MPCRLKRTITRRQARREGNGVVSGIVGQAHGVETPTRRTICATQPVFPALGQRLPICCGEPEDGAKPSGLKRREQNSGTTGRLSFQMPNSCFANR